MRQVQPRQTWQTWQTRQRRQRRQRSLRSGRSQTEAERALLHSLSGLRHPRVETEDDEISGVINDRIDDGEGGQQHLEEEDLDPLRPRDKRTYLKGFRACGSSREITRNAS